MHMPVGMSSRLWLLSVVLFTFTCLLRAQMSFPPAADSHGSQQVTLGNSAEALMGPWKFQLGDDPSWANPNFEDAAWEDYTLIQQGWSESLFEPHKGEDAGWAGHGHRGRSGYGWYRIRVALQSVNGPVTLLVPLIDGAYSVYWDGQKLGDYGDVTRHISYAVPTSNAFSIPIAPIQGATHVLAFRVWSRPLLALENSPQGGGLRGAPLLVQGGIASHLLLLKQRTRIVQRQNAIFLEIIPFAIPCVISLLLFFNRRQHREYLWIALALLSFIFSDLLMFVPPVFGAVRLTNTAFGLSEVPTQSFVLFSLLAAQWLLELQRRRNFRIAILLAGGGYFLAYAALVFNAYVLLSPSVEKILDYAFLMLLPCVAVFLWMAFAGLRTLGRVAWLMLSPSMVILLALLWTIATQGHLSTAVAFGGYILLQALGPVCVLSILAYRFLGQWREHQRIESELQQAQAIQALLVPEHSPQTPGYRVDGTYLPASQVGGDFYQVLPLPGARFLMVLGDVSGKGLRAAMVVSMAVGALRAIVKQTDRPADILDRLNRELTENKIGGFVTCICARVDEDGTVTVSNAGHLPPWVNGQEFAMSGALPLGMMAQVTYEESAFSLHLGDTLTLMSDGVVEARREKDGQLYGFDQLAMLLATRPSAEEIAGTAQRFGQEDDVSVLQVTRTQGSQLLRTS
jgi:Stage II sporulation protein E (SpoIIE)